MSQRALSIVATGDLVLDEPRPEHWLSGIAEATRAADLTIGHLEVPHTRHAEELSGDVPAPGADPAHLAALAAAGFDVVTLAGNHIADCGAPGIADTIAELERLGVGHCGAGMNLEEARRPAIVERNGWRCAVLSYNCVGPEDAWATLARAGCAYLRVSTADGSPVAPARDLRELDPVSAADLAGDVGRARAGADLVIVALHKGVVHTPAVLAPYERPAAHAAIDAGADIVLGHHAHILRGIELYRGRPIFHGLGNGCVVTRALAADQNHPGRAAWAERRRRLFGFEPDPEYTLAPFHPDAVNGLLGHMTVHADGSIDTGFVAVDVLPPGRPVVASSSRAEEIAGYVGDITRRAGLPPLEIIAEGGRFGVHAP